MGKHPLHRLRCAVAVRTSNRGRDRADKKDNVSVVQCWGHAAPRCGFWPLLLEEFTYLVPVFTG